MSRVTLTFHFSLKVMSLKVLAEVVRSLAALQVNTALYTVFLKTDAHSLTHSANIPVTPYEELLENLPNGVYLGWAKIYAEASSKRQKAEFSSVYPMALNIGWSPFYKNKHKTIVNLLAGLCASFCSCFVVVVVVVVVVVTFFFCCTVHDLCCCCLLASFVVTC